MNKIHLVSFNPIWTGGQNAPIPEGFCQISQKRFNRSSPNFLILRQLYMSSFKIQNLGIGHLLLPW